MSLIPCHECQTEISSLAPTCPKCGAPAQPTPAKPEKSTVKATTSPAMQGIGALLLILAIIVGVTKCNNEPKKKAEEPVAVAVQPPPRQPTPDEIAANELGEKRRKALLTAALHIKTTLRNPDSFKIFGVKASEDGHTICIGYRAENGFGGTNVSEAVIVGTKISSARNQIKKHCVADNLNNYTYETNFMLKLAN